MSHHPRQFSRLHGRARVKLSFPPLCFQRTGVGEGVSRALNVTVNPRRDGTGRKDTPSPERAALLALLTPGAADAEPGAGGDLPLSCLIAAELGLQPRFFPTCTGHGTSAAAPGSHGQPGPCAPSVPFPRNREGNRAVTAAGSPRRLSGPRGVGIEAAWRGFQRFLGSEGPARRMRHIPKWWIRQWCQAVAVPRQDHFALAV